MTPHAALALEGITKRFGALVALDDVSLRIRPGTVHALLGENGAGKTTLARVAFGLVQPDSGIIAIAGRTVRLRTPADAITAGIGMVHQHFTSVPAMSVAENVMLGTRGRYRPSQAAAVVREVSARAGVALDPATPVRDLSVNAQQRLEIVKALSRQARLLILDEPAAVLAPPEAAELLRWTRAFADEGNAVLLVTHKLPDALAIADDTTVLRQGRVTLQSVGGRVGEAALLRAMLGDAEQAGEPIRLPTSPAGEIVAELTDVSFVDGRGVKTLEGIRLAVRRGEWVGIAGVDGAGQGPLLRILAKRLLPTKGTVKLPSSIGFIPEDRHREALVLGATLTENVALRGLSERRGLMDWRRLELDTGTKITAFDVRTPGAGASAHVLSGGNQQKLVVGRELDPLPDLLVAENPARGLDVRAAAAVAARLDAACRAGAAVVVYSSDLDDLLGRADRIIVMHGGRAVECPPNRELVGQAMVGLA